MDKLQKPNLNYDIDINIYEKMNGMTEHNNKIINSKVINEYQQELITNYDIVNYRALHDKYVLPEVTINDEKIKIEEFTNNKHTVPVSIEKFIEIDRSSIEFKNNVCVRKLEYKLMLILTKYLNFDLTNKKGADDIEKAKKIYTKKSLELNIEIDWSKLNKFEIGGLIIVNPAPSKLSQDTQAKSNMIQLYKIIFIGYSPIVGRSECIVIRHILFPKYYMSYTTFFTQKQHVWYDFKGYAWSGYHLLNDMSTNQNINVDIVCNTKTITTNVHTWFWDIAERHTLDAIQIIENDFIEWWKQQIDPDATMENIYENYCISDDSDHQKKIYCKNNENKKNTFFYNSCIPDKASSCCDSDNPTKCLKDYGANHNLNKLAKRIIEIGKKVYNVSNDNFKSLRYGKPDISIIGTSLGGGIGTLSILVLIDYFSKKGKKIFNIDASFYNSIKSTTQQSFEIMKEYDNIIPLNMVNTKLEFMVEPNKKYMNILKNFTEISNKNKIPFDEIKALYLEIYKKEIRHITDIYNFIPGVSIDPYTRVNFGNDFDEIPLTFYYFGHKNTIYKDIMVYNGKLCPEYKELLENGKINNNDISNKIFKYINNDERKKSSLTRTEFSKVYFFGRELHNPFDNMPAMEKIYSSNDCHKNGYEY